MDGYLATGAGPRPQRTLPRSFIDAVSTYAIHHRPVAVIAEYLWMSRCLSEIPAHSLRLIDTHDLMHRRLEQYRGTNHYSFFQCTLEDELSCLQRADKVLVIQEEERITLEKHIACDKLLLLPHGHAIVPPLAPKTGKKLLFVGSAHAANVEGIAWFLNNVWPTVSSLDRTSRSISWEHAASL